MKSIIGAFGVAATAALTCRLARCLRPAPR